MEPARQATLLAVNDARTPEDTGLHIKRVGYCCAAHFAPTALAAFRADVDAFRETHAAHAD